MTMSSPGSLSKYYCAHDDEFTGGRGPNITSHAMEGRRSLWGQKLMSLNMRIYEYISVQKGCGPDIAVIVINDGVVVSEMILITVSS
jgi:hypothetical protein